MLVLSAILGVTLTDNPLRILGAFVIVMLGAAFFSCLSMTIAGIVLKRDRLMGIGQMITMPLFFASSALYPVAIMPGWLQVLSKVNPLSYEVDALRGLLIRTPRTCGLDFGVLVLAVVVGVDGGLVARRPPGPLTLRPPVRPPRSCDQIDDAPVMMRGLIAGRATLGCIHTGEGQCS